MIIRRFAKNVENRKDLVNKIATITGLSSRYTGMPLMSYEIGNFTVERDGILSVTVDEVEGGNEGAVILALKADNLIGEEITSQNPHIIENEQNESETSETDSSTIYIPVEEMDDASYSVLGIEDWDPDEQEEHNEADDQHLEGFHVDDELQLNDELQIDEPQLVETEKTEFEDAEEGEAIDSEVSDETVNTNIGILEVAFPFFRHTPTSIINLVCMLHSRGPLLSKATGGNFSASKELTDALLDAGIFFKVEDVVKFIDDFISHSAQTDSATDEMTRNALSDEGDMTGAALAGLRFEDDKVIFDGFTNVQDEAHARTFTHLASAMNKMAQKQKRIQAKTVNDTNEKYALRIWLVRLGMNGDEHKEDRKILIENLTGHTAFRTEAEKEKWTKRQLAKKLALKEQKRLAQINAEQTDTESQRLEYTFTDID